MATYQAEPTAAVPDPGAIKHFFQLLYAEAQDGYLVLNHVLPAERVV